MSGDIEPEDGHMPNAKCPIWGTSAFEEPKDRDGHVMDSPRAGGKYFITDTAAEVLKNHNDQVRARLTSWLVEQRRLRSPCPKIHTRTILETRQRKDLRIPERADGILRYLATRSDHLGDEVKFSTFIDPYDKSLMPPTEQEKECSCLLAHSESINKKDLSFLLDYLDQHGLIENTALDGVMGGCALTDKGYTRVDELKNLDAPVEEVGRQNRKDVRPLHRLLQVPLAKLQRWSLPGIRVWWKIAAATVILLAALASLLVDSQAIKGWFTTDSRPVATSGGDRTSPVQVAPGPNKDVDEAAAPASGGDRTSPVQVAPSPNKDADEAAAPERPQDAVLIGNSRAELRERNGLRRMLDTEDGQVLSRLIGVYGFASHLSLAHRFKSTDGPHLGLDLSSLRLGREHSTAREAELHALGEGRAMVLVNVSRGDAARLSDPTEDVGEIFGFFFDGNEGRTVLVGIPVSRVRTWQSRTQEFAVIDVN